MTGIGALNLKVDVKTRDGFCSQIGPGNPEAHRRRTLSIVLENVDNNVRGLFDANRHRRVAQFGYPRGDHDRPGAVGRANRGQCRRARSSRCAISQRPKYEVLPSTISR